MQKIGLMQHAATYRRFLKPTIYGGFESTHVYMGPRSLLPPSHEKSFTSTSIFFFSRGHVNLFKIETNNYLKNGPSQAFGP